MTSIRPAADADMAAVADLWHEGWHDGHAGHVPDGLSVFAVSTLDEARTIVEAIGEGADTSGFASCPAA